VGALGRVSTDKLDVGCRFGQEIFGRSHGSGRDAPIPDLASQKGWSSRRNQTLRMPPECVSLNLSHHRHDEERRDAAISATVASARNHVASLVMMGRSTEAGMAHIKGLHHNAYRCRDSEETRAWYEDFLGLKLVSAFPIDEGRALHTFFQMDDGSCLAFFEVPGKPFDFKRQDALDLHIALGVDNDVFERMLQKGRARAIEVRGPDLPPEKWTPGYAVLRSACSGVM
jgi:catechol 2,3-dioxygenase-like lactoylglutathione lyase family enzyme